MRIRQTHVCTSCYCDHFCSLNTAYTKIKKLQKFSKFFQFFFSKINRILTEFFSNIKKLRKLFSKFFSNFFFRKIFFTKIFFYKFLFGENFYYRIFFGENFSFHKNISAKIFFIIFSRMSFVFDVCEIMYFANFFIRNFAYFFVL